MKTFTSAKPNTFYYVTSVTRRRIPVFKDDRMCEILISVFSESRVFFPFKLIAYVIMPDHFHFIVNPQDCDISKLLLRIRGFSARLIINEYRSRAEHTLLNRLRLDSPQKRDHKYSLWQKDPLIVDLESHKFLVQKTGYIHNNPVRAKLVDHPARWKWSSYHSLLPHDQGVVPIEIDKAPYWTDNELKQVVS